VKAELRRLRLFPGSAHEALNIFSGKSTAVEQDLVTTLSTVCTLLGFQKKYLRLFIESLPIRGLKNMLIWESISPSAA